MITRTLRQLATMSGGTIHENADADLLVQGLFKDSRKPRCGALYVPLMGERFDGHDFIQHVFDAGAAASFWQKDHDVPPQGNFILVDHVLTALQQLAAAYLGETNASVVGITGSNGKTTTKDIVSALLSTSYKVHKTDGNYNNHIGLPLTVLNMDEDTDIVILEMGMSGRGEIELLSNIAQPDVAVVTNVGESHLLQLGSRHEIARAKLEITMGMKKDSMLIYNGDEPLLTEMIAASETVRSKGLHLTTFGLSSHNDAFPMDINGTEQGYTFVSSQTEGEAVELPLLGKHNVVNCLAAMAVAYHFHVNIEYIRRGLSSLKLTGMRIEKIACASGLTLLNDAYNASPSSMRVALDTLGGYATKGRKVAVLGDMFELGADEVRYHKEVGAYAARSGADLLFTCGELGHAIADGAVSFMSEPAVHAYQDKEALINVLKRQLHPDDTVLIKASRGMKMEDIVEALKDASL